MSDQMVDQTRRITTCQEHSDESLLDECLHCRIAELEARSKLALELNAFFVGFVADALHGRKLDEMPKSVQKYILAERVDV